MENYLIIISHEWTLIHLVVRSDTRNHAAKLASKWIKANCPELVGKCDFKIHDFSQEGAGVVFVGDIPLM